MTTSKINSLGRAIPLEARRLPDRGVTEEDVQDPKRLARLLTQVVGDSADAKGRHNPRAVYFDDVSLVGDGTEIRLTHGFGTRARWVLLGFYETTTGGVSSPELWVRRVLNGPGTLARIAGDYTVGTRFTTSVATRVTGAKFPWVSTGGTRTVTATLWRDPVGASPQVVLATGSVSCTASGIYLAAFTTPAAITGESIGAGLTLGIYDGGAGYTKTATDSVFTALLPIAYPVFTVSDLRLYSAGNARPTSTAATELYWVEPSFAAPPRVVEDAAASDTNTLVLRSWTPGVATIRLERDA